MEKALLTFAVGVWLLVGGFALVCSAERTTPQEPIEPTTSSISPKLILDSEGDGYNDWFEKNFVGYDPNIPNDRYVILYFRRLKDPNAVPYTIDKPSQFFIREGVPSENIFKLSQKGANATTLENAIKQIASKSDKNDIVFLKITTHGSSSGFSGGVIYKNLNEWIDKIDAKAVIIAVEACGCRAALPALENGRCPRIVFVNSGGEFVRALGNNIDYFTAADTNYGNGDGYVSMKEIGNWIDNDPKWGPDWGTLRGKGRSYYQATGESKWVDTTGIADQIFLTDYTPE